MHESADVESGEADTDGGRAFLQELNASLEQQQMAQMQQMQGQQQGK